MIFSYNPSRSFQPAAAKMRSKHVLLVSILLVVSCCVGPSEADFFEFMANGMKLMGRVFGVDLGGTGAETREADSSRTAERIKALHDAARFVSDAQEKAGKRVLKERRERIMKGMANMGSSSSSSDDAPSSLSSSGLSDLLSESAAASTATTASSALSDLLAGDDSGLAALLADTTSASSRSSLSSSLSSSSSSDLDQILRRTDPGTRRQLNLILAKIIVERLKQRRRIGLN